ncbi:MAG: hypothetical protein RMI91_04355 [Gemmatales bacterium]|nr:hypothetical protein [Gemmatales bacterium]MDW7993867.1 hypothetical protein [Gemmatales bacterium]
MRRKKSWQLALLIGMGVAWPGVSWAGWHNVFQVTCFHRSTPVVAQAPPVVVAPAPTVAAYAPQQVCTTQYVQRCYYQPVTSYRFQVYYEPVTTYRTSYYYEPVVSYRYSCYFDPCTCTYQQVATPVTSYQLRAYYTPVTSYVRRCGFVPVTSYRACCYLEPQTTCYTLDPCSGQPMTTPTVPDRQPTVPAPSIQEYRTPSDSGSPLYNRTYPPPSQPPEGSGPYKPQMYSPPPPPVPSVPRPAVPRLDRIALENPADGHGAIAGMFVDPGNAAPVVQVVFVNEQANQRSTVQPDAQGRFQVRLAAGQWRVLIRDDQGREIPYSTLHLQPGEYRQLTLTSYADRR